MADGETEETQKHFVAVFERERTEERDERFRHGNFRVTSGLNIKEAEQKNI